MRELTEAENDGYAEEFFEGIDPRIRLDALRTNPTWRPHTAGLRGAEGGERRMSVDPALAKLARDVAALRTWEELAEDEMPLAGDPLDDLILHARDLVDTLGIRAENGEST